VAFVERLLPRHWDGRRLLQFLTGLALLALAFAMPGAAVATPASPAPVSAVVSTSAAATAEDQAAASAAQSDQAAATVDVLLTGPSGVAFVPVAAVPVETRAFADSESQGAWGSRGPPRV
jgi:hypothetical protein